MDGTLEYAPRADRYSRWLDWGAFLLLFYPVLLVGAFYAEWLWAWAWLGHQPRPSLDDPKGIAGWMHPVVTVLFMGMIAAALAGVGLNVAHALLNGRGKMRGGLRVLFVILLWVGAIAFLKWDPWNMLEWWID